jgi:hypothetical protein
MVPSTPPPTTAILCVSLIVASIVISKLV